MEQEMYFKVYLNKEACSDTSDYYVASYEEVVNTSLDEWMISSLEDGELMPVIEPVMMKQAEYNNLPEFEGF
jgi:hypothetical protein